MKRAALILLVVILAVPLAAIVAAHFLLDPAAIKARVEAAVLHATGRELRIAGPVRLAWSLPPEIQASDVSFANPPGFSRPAMAHVDRIEATLGLLPLLSHQVAIDRLTLVGPDILFERDAKGRANWLLTPPQAAAAAPATAPSSGGSRFDLVLGNLLVSDAKLTWRGGQTLQLAVPRLTYDPQSRRVAGELDLRGTALQLSGTAGPIAGATWPLDLHLAGGGLTLSASGTSAGAGVAGQVADLSTLSALAARKLPPLRDVSLAANLSGAGLSGLELRAGATAFGPLHLQQASATAPSLDGPVDLHAALTEAALPIAVAAHANSLSALLAGATVPVTLHLSTDDAVLDATGTASATGAVLALTGRTGDLARTGAMAQLALPALHDLALQAKATLTPVQLTLDALKLTSGQGDLQGHLVLAAAPRPSLRGALTSTRLDLTALVPVPLPHAPHAPQPAQPAPPRPANNRVIPDTPLPWAALRSADADLQFQAAALTWRGRSYDHVAAHLLLDGGKLSLDPASMQFGGKSLSAQLHADAAAQSATLASTAPGLPAGAVLALFGVPATGAGTLDLAADLTAHGGTWRALAATLQGHAQLSILNAEIENAWLLAPLETALRNAKLPIPTGGDSKLRCATIRFDAKAGKLDLQTLALDTTKLDLTGTGDIDLANETLDLHLRPTLRLGTALTVPVHLGGTLLVPKATLDPGALAAGRVGIMIGGKAPASTCAATRSGHTSPPLNLRKLKPADLLRSLLR